MKTFDIVVWDDLSAPFNPVLAEHKALGGVEWTLMLLAEALADEGLSVLVLNRSDRPWTYRPICQAGWLEYGHVSRAFVETIACRTLIVSRSSAVPPVLADRVVFSLHDIPETWMFAGQRRWLDDGAAAVCVSSWQAAKLGAIADWCRPVIAPMMLDECYARGPKDPNVFVYASAAMKGLRETIDAWALIRRLFPETHLTELWVATNGNDSPSKADAARMVDLGARSLGQLPARRMLAALRNAAGLFFVNTYPETHCIVAGAALALGCRCHVLTLADPAALPETLADSPLLTADSHAFVEQFVARYRGESDWAMPLDRVPDRRARALLPAWKEVLLDA